MKAIPTNYHHINFRSRLEAKWAAFFDLVGWKWEYEPIDLEGWAPDFLIHGKKAPIYVEVKPANWIVCERGYPTLDLSLFGKATNNEIIATAHILLLGICPYIKDGTLYLGACSDDLRSESGFSGATAQRVIDGSCHFGYCSEAMGFDDRITGFYPGGESGGHGDLADRFWKEACNNTQWMAV
jgi:hypothetical protein